MNAVAPPLLQLEAVDTYYGQIHILQGVNLAVGEGELVCLLGGNASGKSTTLKTILGIVSPRNGVVRFGGEEITGRPTAHRIARGLAIVPENRRVFAPMSVLENLEMGAYLRPKADLKEEFERVYGLFPLLYERRKQLAGTLSGGEQQMLAMGRALMSKPKLLLMDEPSMGLAPILVERSFEIIQQVHQAGVAMLIVEQNANVSLSIADRGYVLSTGRVVLEGKAKDLLEDEDLRKAYLGRYSRPGRLRSGQRRRRALAALPRWPVGGGDPRPVPGLPRQGLRQLLLAGSALRRRPRRVRGVPRRLGRERGRVGPLGRALRGGAGRVRRAARRGTRRRRDPDLRLRRRQRPDLGAPVPRRAQPDRHLRERVPDDRPDRARAGAARSRDRPRRARPRVLCRRDRRAHSARRLDARLLPDRRRARRRVDLRDRPWARRAHAGGRLPGDRGDPDRGVACRRRRRRRHRQVPARLGWARVHGAPTRPRRGARARPDRLVRRRERLRHANRALPAAPERAPLRRRDAARAEHLRGRRRGGADRGGRRAGHPGARARPRRAAARGPRRARREGGGAAAADRSSASVRRTPRRSWICLPRRTSSRRSGTRASVSRCISTTRATTSTPSLPHWRGTGTSCSSLVRRRSAAHRREQVQLGAVRRRGNPRCRESSRGTNDDLPHLVRWACSGERSSSRSGSRSRSSWSWSAGCCSSRPSACKGGRSSRHSSLARARRADCCAERPRTRVRAGGRIDWAGKREAVGRHATAARALAASSSRRALAAGGAAVASVESRGLELRRELGAKRAAPPAASGRREAMRLNEQAAVLRSEERLGEAIELSEQALAIFRTLGDTHGTALTLNGLGLTQARIGDEAGALDSYETRSPAHRARRQPRCRPRPGESRRAPPRAGARRPGTRSLERGAGAVRAGDARARAHGAPAPPRELGGSRAPARSPDHRRRARRGPTHAASSPARAARSRTAA